MPIIITSPVAVLPVDLELAIRHMNVTSYDAALVQLYLQAAVDLIEDYTGRVLLTKGYQLQLDSWPNYRSFWPTFRSYVPTEIHPLWTDDNLRAIELRRSPLDTIDSVMYWPPCGVGSNPPVLTAFDPTAWSADTASTPGRLVFVENGTMLPDVQKRSDAVQINFHAGYGSLSSGVPPALRVAVFQFATSLFNSRSPVSDAKLAEIPYSLQRILQAYRVPSLTQVK